ncbi:MAG TPA: TetR/AcrR family transcriptional regulator, partial [Ramlibacter sp.]|nr:TetR/AcrR family transcriptional regulator [Ramlibacter sp.]
EEVAARAGVSKGTPFLYFPTKEELFKAVVRENVAGRLAEWNEEYSEFQGSTADMLRYCLRAWWDRIGATKASGITKLMFSEAQNFPEVAAFYQREVIIPGTALIRRILQRGVDRGEFEIPDIDYAVFSVITPVIFLLMNKHSVGACVPADQPIDVERYLAAQGDTLLRGFNARPAAPATKERK